MNTNTSKTVERILREVVPATVQIPWLTYRFAPGVGLRRSRAIGADGYRIKGIRRWAPGDRLDAISTGKTGWREPLATDYFEDQELVVYVIARTGTSMEFGSRRVIKKVLAAEIVASIIAGAKDKCDKVGFIAYSDCAVEMSLPLRPAAQQLNLALHMYLDAQARDQAGRPKFGLQQALQLLPSGVRCLVFIVSDFHSLSDEDVSMLNYSKHDVGCFIVGDRRERELQEGKGMRQFRDITSGRTLSTDLSEAGRKQWTAEFDAARKLLKERLHQAGCSTAEFETHTNPAAQMVGILSGASK